VTAALVPSRNLCAFDYTHQRIAVQFPISTQGFDEQFPATSKDALVELKLPETAGASGNHPRCQECKHPTNIRGGDEVKRAAHGPGADNFSFRNR
jgi:hypothetical protein